MQICNIDNKNYSNVSKPNDFDIIFYNFKF